MEMPSTREFIERLLVQGHCAAASGALEIALNQENRPDWAVYLLSRVTLHKGNTAEAVQLAVEAYNAAPQTGEYVTYLSDLLILCKHEEAATELMAQYLTSKPSDVAALQACVRAQEALIKRRAEEHKNQTLPVLTRLRDILALVLKGKKLVIDTLEHPFIGGLAIDAVLSKVQSRWMPRKHDFLVRKTGKRTASHHAGPRNPDYTRRFNQYHELYYLGWRQKSVRD